MTVTQLAMKELPKVEAARYSCVACRTRLWVWEYVCPTCEYEHIYDPSTCARFIPYRDQLATQLVKSKVNPLRCGLPLEKARLVYGPADDAYGGDDALNESHAHVSWRWSQNERAITDTVTRQRLGESHRFKDCEIVVCPNCELTRKPNSGPGRFYPPLACVACNGSLDSLKAPPCSTPLIGSARFISPGFVSKDVAVAIILARDKLESKSFFFIERVLMKGGNS